MTNTNFIMTHKSELNRDDRNKINDHQSGVIWFTGLSASGKSTIAHTVEKRLYEKEIRTYVLDGDNIRHGLNSDLGFSVEDRNENIRRISEVAKLLMDAGVLVLCAFITPYENEREQIMQLIGADNVLMVYVQCSLETCEKRDPKGLYKKARQGIIQHYTGVSAPYEIPRNPAIILNSQWQTLEESVQILLKHIEHSNFLV